MMMIFSVDQLEHLKAQAQVLWNTLEHRYKNGYTPEMQVAFLVGYLQEACSMGRAIGWDEATSTPWKYHLISMAESESDKDGRMRQATMGVLSDLGWEPFMACGSWLILRRRKAIGDAEETDTTS